MSATLIEFYTAHKAIFVLTGAGISTASGIPDYRDESGAWKHQKPMEYRDFVERHAARQRYWARSFVGWQRFRQAEPNRAHRALAQLQARGRVGAVVTQNVDGLQQRAGSHDVIELHGSLARVGCLDCGDSIERETMQQRLLVANPLLAQLAAEPRPDGDAQLARFDDSELRVPECKSCGGILKPRVVFFGETVPAATVERCFDALARADSMLVIGSSLMVYSGFRFVREAVARGLPVAAINRGKTRADAMLALKLEADCADALATVIAKPEQNQALTI